MNAWKQSLFALSKAHTQHTWSYTSAVRKCCVFGALWVGATDSKVGELFFNNSLGELLRIVRLLRLLHLVEELSKIIISLSSSLSSLSWVLALLGILTYFFSVLFTQLSVLHVSPDDPQFDDLMSFFGSIPTTAFTLFASIFGGLGWDVPAKLLASTISPVACLLFFLFIASFQIAMMNIITGVFVDKAMRTGHEVEEQNICNRVTDVFFKDGNKQSITWDAFEKKLQTADMESYLKAIDVSVSEAQNLFELLDTDNSRTVNCSELVNGLLRLRGNAGALEVSLLLRELSHIRELLDKRMLC
eukprot:TRINITY_DN22690_c0_g1_i2.p1 TRINITY_DN22690_c0_g1~~TRINITY_DN22690_c0_g1_i2.p1  ORF type:complete len:302 (-),score=48.27 TRINITY_DN22690_c0_g1_i2:369-1274(-)